VTIRVLYVAYPLLTVSDESAGGAEQVLWTLEREIARRGALTTVAASAGSRVSGELFSTGGPCTRPDDYERRRIEHEDRVIDFVRRRAREGMAFDLVHDQSGSFWRRAAEIDSPVLATLHLPRSFYPAGSFDEVPENVSFNCVSDSQARSFADLGPLLGAALNGIALDCFAGADGAEMKREIGDRRGLLWLGRICEEKAPHLALEIAACAGLPITIAGQVYPFSYHQQYFEREVTPRLSEIPDAEFVSAPAAARSKGLTDHEQGGRDQLSGGDGSRSLGRASNRVPARSAAGSDTRRRDRPVGGKRGPGCAGAARNLKHPSKSLCAIRSGKFQRGKDG
jgi:hypothetical protein